MDWQPEGADPAVGSFMPAFRWVCEHTTGPVLELGGGYFSTPYLHELHTNGRDVCTYEYDLEWVRALRAQFDHLITPGFAVIARRYWEVVLVDCEGWNRKPFFGALAQSADVFVIHDSQDGWIPEELLTTYVYRRDLDENPRTTVVSDTLDVASIP